MRAYAPFPELLDAGATRETTVLLQDERPRHGKVGSNMVLPHRTFWAGAESCNAHPRRDFQVVVSGAGGHETHRSAPDQWSAHHEDADTGLVAGALVCTLNVDGVEDLAFCKYVDFERAVLDTFWLRTAVAGDTSADATEESLHGEPESLHGESETGFSVTLQIFGREDFAQHGSTSVTPSCSAPAADLAGPGVTGLRFLDVPVAPDDAITRATIVLSAASSEDCRGTGLSIRVEANSIEAPCAASLHERQLLTTEIRWDVGMRGGLGQRLETPDLAPVIRELIQSPSWSKVPPRTLPTPCIFIFASLKRAHTLYFIRGVR